MSDFVVLSTEEYRRLKAFEETARDNVTLSPEVYRDLVADADYWRNYLDGDYYWISGEDFSLLAGGRHKFLALKFYHRLSDEQIEKAVKAFEHYNSLRAEQLSLELEIQMLYGGNPLEGPKFDGIMNIVNLVEREE